MLRNPWALITPTPLWGADTHAAAHAWAHDIRYQAEAYSVRCVRAVCMHVHRCRCRCRCAGAGVQVQVQVQVCHAAPSIQAEVPPPAHGNLSRVGGAPEWHRGETNACPSLALTSGVNGGQLLVHSASRQRISSVAWLCTISMATHQPHQPTPLKPLVRLIGSPPHRARGSGARLNPTSKHFL